MIKLWKANSSYLKRGDEAMNEHNEHTKPNTIEFVEFLVAPIPPDTVATVKAEIASVTQQVLEEGDQAQLWDEGEIQVEVEKTLSLEEQLVVVGVQLVSALAVKAFENLVLPKWKERFEVKKRKSKRKRKSKK